MRNRHWCAVVRSVGSLIEAELLRLRLEPAGRGSREEQQTDAAGRHCIPRVRLAGATRRHAVRARATGERDRLAGDGFPRRVDCGPWLLAAVPSSGATTRSPAGGCRAAPLPAVPPPPGPGVRQPPVTARSFGRRADGPRSRPADAPAHPLLVLRHISPHHWRAASKAVKALVRSSGGLVSASPCVTLPIVHRRTSSRAETENRLVMDQAEAPSLSRAAVGAGMPRRRASRMRTSSWAPAAW